MADDLDAFGLLERPIGELGLSAATCEYLKKRRIRTVSDLLDDEWAVYPAAIADEIRAAVAARGLRALQSSPEESPEEAPLPREERAAREWSRIDWQSDEGDHVSTHDTGGHIDWSLLTGSTRWRQMTRLWIEHWKQSGTDRDDYRPWLRALADHPPAALEDLTIGGYSGRSHHAILGDLEPALCAQSRLRELDLCGDLRGAGTIAARALESLALESSTFAVADLDRLLSVDMPRLREATFSIWDDDPLDLAPLGRFLARCPELRDVTVDLGRLTAAFVDALAGGRSRHLAVLQLERCAAPENDGELAGVIDALVRAGSRLQGATVALPTELEDHAGRLAAAGLRCTFGD